ncbi:flagellar biosynthetic protein FliO [Pararhizobium sp. YC-54]|uniref:flagellar biosynthetic protein FliO n=1 Tax=Pararhizobium sp. YC-54 TaxID=2986920 RepID=UPI0021F6B3C4|nr:flagellar biosynthetic protein FliO [Pararhizobium sp. YC-54]MCV9996875.1 flagellar biosynthetic protein FliO [Pararhizobium sp. YC-54]
MIEDIVGNNGTRFIIAAGAVALGLLCLVAVLRFMRNRPSSPFIRGGKNRQPRLAVLDAAAIDTRRRLVLVRRDDVEHLIMIGGPTDVVIESRIASQGLPVQQAAVAAAVPETVVARPAAERRIASQPETKAAPVSAMGQVLYGEGSEASPPLTRAAQVRPQPDTIVSAAAPRQAVAERQIPVQPQPRPQPGASGATPSVSLETARSPEDILDAARSRVLAANQPVAVQRPVQAAPVATAAQIPAIPGQKDTSALEFERILDAEISGDLGKLTADDVRVDGDTRANTTAPVPAARQEPRLGAAQASRTEPTLEDEMNRMLNEIAVNRKN